MYQALEAAVRVGDVLAAKYRVDRVLGEGGMGVVVAATHLQLDQVVALKFIRSEAMQNPEIVARFEREARVAVRLKSEHAARIIDVGRLDSGAPYIVMEYLEGKDLSQVLEQRRSLPVELACDYVIQACDAIAEAHRLGIVHRDLKPGNLFLASTSHGQQTIKVLDFGISKAHWLAGEVNVTRTQAVMGSPGYMSPEQMRSTKNVDGRTDVWSLGVILYELIAGRTPFQADTFSGLCVKIAVDPHPPLLPLPGQLPAGFTDVVDRVLEKDPALRYPSAAALAQALAPYAGASARERASRLVAANGGAMPSAARPVMLGAQANTIDAAAGQAVSQPPRSRERAKTMVAAGAGIVVVAALGVLIGVARGGGDRGASRAAAQPVVMQPVAVQPVVVPLDAPPPDAPPPVDSAAPAVVKPIAPARPRPAALDPYSSPD